MAEPQKKAAAQSGAVASCAAVDCRHNEDASCHAESVTIQFEGRQPVCGTYEKETPAVRP